MKSVATAFALAGLLAFTGPVVASEDHNSTRSNLSQRLGTTGGTKKPTRKTKPVLRIGGKKTKKKN